MKATIDDIAQQLEVSKSTVSRSLRQDPAIHPRTRARVAEAAMRLGYEGKTQRGSRTPSRKHSMGVLMVAGSSDLSAIHVNAVRMLQGISEECDGLGISLMLHTIAYVKRGNMPSDPELVPGSVRDHAVEAILLIGPHLENDVEFIAAQVPVVTLSWQFRGVETDAVLLDNIEGIAGQVQKLVDAGHRRLAWVPPQYSASFYTARQSGFVQGCLANGLELSDQCVVQTALLPDPKPFANSNLRGLLEGGVTGFVCANDSIATLLMKEMAEQGIRVPDDVSLTGFDAMSVSDQNGPVLDSVDPHFQAVGRDAVRLAMRRIQNPTARMATLTVRSSVVEGGTVGRVRSATAPQ